MFSLDSLILQGAASFKSIVCLFVFLAQLQVGFDKYLVCIYILANPSASQWLVHQTQVSKHRATSICSNCISSHPFPVIFHFKSEPQGSLLISKWVIETPGEPLIKSRSSAVFQSSTRIGWTMNSHPFVLNHCLINATRSLEIPANVTFFFNYTSFITPLFFIVVTNLAVWQNAYMWLLLVNKRQLAEG